MYTQVSRNNFHDAFKGGTYQDNFSYEWLNALYDYLEEYEEGTDTKIELDVIAICCEYTEYNNLEAIKNSYNNINTIEDLEDRTTVIRIPDTDKIIIQEL